MQAVHIPLEVQGVRISMDGVGVFLGCDTWEGFYRAQTRVAAAVVIVVLKDSLDQEEEFWEKQIPAQIQIAQMKWCFQIQTIRMSPSC